MKRCTKCGVEKPLDDFYPDKRSAARRRKDGYLAQCKVCKRARNADWIKAHPDRHRNLMKWWYQENREKALEQSAQWRSANREQASRVERAGRLKRLYGMSPAQMLELFERQDRKCAVCRSPDPKNKYGWHIDHDHITRVVRGVLCARCNHMLGHARDNIEILRAAISYLEGTAC